MPDKTWWKHGIIYQIYPRSFQDSNGDGIGDLEGIRSRLDYVRWLGVHAIWISPIFPSPMADFGYDVSDYCGIDPIFGTLADFEHMLADAHAHGLKVILDFVPNHTSEQHEWFKESRSSKDNPKRDWYIWRDSAPDGGPPNNWLSNFGGSAWEKDEASGQYYYHAFLKEQPDLNWRNPEVRRAMYDVLRCWLDRGVDGFRVDVIWHLMKDPEFRDNPLNLGYESHQSEVNRLLQVHSADHPDVHQVIREMRKVIDAYPGRVLIGEIYLPLERLLTYYGEDLSGTHLPFNFALLQTPWKARQIAQLVKDYDTALPDGGWPNWVLGNHDQPRIAARIGAEQARVAAMLLLTLRGTPTLYYGDEIGMAQVAIPPDRVQDPWEKNEPGLGFGRDPERTPMQWDKTALAGFTTGTPWLPLAETHGVCNVEVLAEDPSSILTLYRRIIALRRTHAALSIGSYIPLDLPGDNILAYRRRHGEECLTIVLNLGSGDEQVNVGETQRVVLSTCLDREEGRVGPELHLRPNEGIILSGE
jgi:alpha-glucosidase